MDKRLLTQSEHLGDGAFVEFDGFCYRIFAERQDGTHEVFLELGAIKALLRFVERTS